MRKRQQAQCRTYCLVRAWLCFSILLLLILCRTTAVRAASITDQSGETIHFSKPFQRLISLYPAHTENLFSLGLDQEIIGVSKNDTYPEQAALKQRFHYREDPEKFIAAQPDLVLVRPMIARAYPDLINKLHLAGITVVSLQPTSITEMYAYWQTLGALTGRSAQAEAMITAFTNDIARVTGRLESIAPQARKRVYFEAIHKKMKTFAPGSISVFVLETAGAVNLASDAQAVRKTNIASYGKERILAKAADIDVFLAQQGKMNRITKKIIREEPGFRAIKAVQTDSIFLIDETIVSRPTLRLASGIEQISRLLYPELF